MLPSDLVDQAAAAGRLSISPRTLETWRLRGGGPAYYKLGRRVRYSLVELGTWLEEQRRSHTSAVEAA